MVDEEDEMDSMLVHADVVTAQPAPEPSPDGCSGT